ncbi:MAG: adenylosuccinate synthetase [Oscillospiraceae bacterium]|nr:adenylosuccinate synthetase [Oscillospiraceae bacterium]
MVTNIKVVTGASYGDEGKGMMTAYFSEAARKDGRRSLNILHNGGGQRGHTVNDRKGHIFGNSRIFWKRHVFHHLGSGSFSGADTYFSEDFILNPIIFAEEMNELGSLGNLPVKIYRNKKCRWSTPYDMMINQIAEDYRGDDRHGSCGAGIWETILRYDTLPCPELSEFAALPKKARMDFLDEVREYAKKRLFEIGVKSIPEKWRENMESRGLAEHFLEDVMFLSRAAKAAVGVPEGYRDVVFEGGQGLLLSERLMDIYGSDRYLTPSFTGNENPVKIIREMGGKYEIEGIEVCYVTRSYLTRHGAGSFPGECPKEAINPDMADLTNMPNDYQGTLRYGRIDLSDLNRRIGEDFAGYKGLKNVPRIIRSAAVTHLNETMGMLEVTGGTAAVSEIEADRVYMEWSENLDEIITAGRVPLHPMDM